MSSRNSPDGAVDAFENLIQCGRGVLVDSAKQVADVAGNVLGCPLAGLLSGLPSGLAVPLGDFSGGLLRVGTGPAAPREQRHKVLKSMEGKGNKKELGGW